MTSARQLLDSIDALPYGARQRRLAARAREMAGTTELTALLDDLHGHGWFGRRVALHLADVAGDRAYVERCLTAEETDVVRAALGIAVRVGVAPEVIAGLVPGLATTQRRTLYARVRRGKAVALAGVLLPAVRARFGDVEAAILLPVCDAGTISALLPDLAYAVTGWRMLAHRHPTVFLDWLDTQLAGPSSGWQDVLDRTSGGLAAVAGAEPERVLAVLSHTVSRVWLFEDLGGAWAALAKHDPARLLEFLVDPRRKSSRIPHSRRLWRALLATSDDDLARLARIMEVESRPDFFGAIPPARRPAVYAAAFGARDGDPELLPVIDQLPVQARAAEAQRLLGLRAVADDPTRRIEVTARLTWEAAKETLYAATRRSTAQERPLAYQCLVTAAAGSRDPRVVTELLRSLDRLPNEQDPVREAALGALARVPARLFLPAAAPALLTMMTDAMTARDCSWSTLDSLHTLILNLVRHGAVTGQPDLIDAGVAALRGLAWQRSWPVRSTLGRNLPRGGEHRVFEALRARIAEDARHDSFEVALALASGLGRRAWDMPELQEFVDRARRAADDRTVRAAADLWLAPPRTRAERLGAVFHADRSTITIPSVRNGIGFLRTDLVDEALTTSLHGRFLKEGVTFVPEFDRCFHRWLPRQCAAYADRLAVLADDKKQPWERARAVAQLARVPGTAERVRGYLADTEVTVVEAALGGLAWTDEPADVLADLMSYVDTDRARVAVYAATRCANFVPPDRLGEVLAPALASRKVTSRKEAVRLLAVHHAPDVAGLLQSVWQRPDEHRDVRRAIVSAARWCLDDERTWALLESAAAAEHNVATAVLGLDPRGIAVQHRPRYAALVRAVADSPATDTARLGLAAMWKWVRWDGAEADTLVARFTDLANTATWHAAMEALLAACGAAENTAPVVTAATTLLATREPATTADRDLPARQRLYALADRIHAPLMGGPEWLRGAAAELADLLAADRTLRRVTLRLAIYAVNFVDDDDAAITRLVTLADEPQWAWHARNDFAGALRWAVPRLPQASLLDIAEALAARSPAPAPQLLALAMAEVVGETFGWSQGWRELVTRLRTHDDAHVRLGALTTFTSSEQ